MSEVVNLLTARLVGLGVIGHHVSFSLQAVILTTVGFVAIKLAAFLILSGKLARKQIGDLLVDTPETEKKQLPAPVYGVSAVLGLVALVIAYCQGIGGYSWISVKYMAVTITLGFVGMFLLFSVSGSLLMHWPDVQMAQNHLLCSVSGRYTKM